MIKDLYTYKNNLATKYVKVANNVIFDLKSKSSSSNDYDHCEQEISKYWGQSVLSAFNANYCWCLPTIVIRYAVAKHNAPSASDWQNRNIYIPLMHLIEEGDFMVQPDHSNTSDAWGKIYIQNHPAIYNNSYEKKFKQEIYDYIWTLLKQGKNRDQIYDALPIWLKCPENNWSASAAPQNSYGYLVVNNDGSPLSIEDFLKGKGRIDNTDYRWKLNDIGYIAEVGDGQSLPPVVPGNSLIITRVEFWGTGGSDVIKYITNQSTSIPTSHAYNMQLNNMTKSMLDSIIAGLAAGTITAHMQNYIHGVLPGVTLSDATSQIIMDTVKERLEVDINTPQQGTNNWAMSAYIKDEQTETEEVTVSTEDNEQVTLEVYKTNPKIITTTNKEAAQAKTAYQYEEIMARTEDTNNAESQIIHGSAEGSSTTTP